jgi:hypothetical protein
VNDLVTGLLDRGYDQQAVPVLRGITSTLTRDGSLLQTRLREVERRAAELEEAGEQFQADDPVLRAFLSDLDTVMRGNAVLLDGAGEGLQASGSDAAGTVQRQLALPGFTDTQLRAVGVQWNTPDPEAVAEAVNYIQSNSWSEMLEREFAGLIPRQIGEQAVGGIAQGWSPLRTARVLRDSSETLPLYQANNLMRTLQLTSYRDGTAVHQNANMAIARRVIRVETLDARTCLSCVSLHGDVMWDSEANAGEPIPRVNDHHQGRGTSVIQVVGRELNMVTGEQWFASLPRERQQQQASFLRSPAKWEAYQEGAVQLRDFRQDYEDETFGAMIREGSLRNVLGAGASQYYRRR